MGGFAPAASPQAGNFQARCPEWLPATLRSGFGNAAPGPCLLTKKATCGQARNVARETQQTQRKTWRTKGTTWRMAKLETRNVEHKTETARGGLDPTTRHSYPWRRDPKYATHKAHKVEHASRNLGRGTQMSNPEIGNAKRATWPTATPISARKAPAWAP